MFRDSLFLRIAKFPSIDENGDYHDHNEERNHRPQDGSKYRVARGFNILTSSVYIYMDQIDTLDITEDGADGCIVVVRTDLY
jgi:hypothetical protein